MSTQAHTLGDANTRATEYLRQRVALSDANPGELAERVGKYRAFFYLRLAGERQWRANDLDLLADALRVPKADLWFGVSRAVAS